jgi:acetylornithine deacetylase/succinyl-diaminopimelate desuccinylase-like protein
LQSNGLLDKTVKLFTSWVERRGVPGLRLEVIKEPKRTPLLFIEIPGSIDDTVLMYGHLDKQPPMTGWIEGLGPYSPVVRDGKLYGRGGADDGYAVFAAITALEALRLQGIGHARAVIIIEACEESGSPDLPYYVSKLAPRIGVPSLIVCLDSGCGNYEQSEWWCQLGPRTLHHACTGSPCFRCGRMPVRTIVICHLLLALLSSRLQCG